MPYGYTVGPNSSSVPNALAQTDTELAPIPSALAEIWTFDPDAYASASVSLIYDYRVTAIDQTSYDTLAAYLATHQAANGMGIGIDFSGTAQLASTVSAGADANVYSGLGNDGDVHFSCYDGSGQCGSFNYAGQGSLTGDAATLTFSGTINLSVSVTKAGPGNAVHALSMIDPLIQLTAGFGTGSPSDYMLELSPGVANARGPAVSGVPEFASWAMMVAGFGMTGAAMRRRTARERATV
ncbi:MAG TPA: PEPxxWA-CTERM sorting domain-containing protein [Sphingomonas sp.]|uniref:PEPxxWA-CTERM sorting domain-containing protein n=1 Tax=Sphingomonas sp. TaxID=28214 RepID=UPI002C72A908|nr:PEPxxWA-CTERM sorting domain-containing protein [Sphingomonas sp.]HMI21108.1 PEPxxWA-CTERM sorting domain-containing protein [Sphingomonas sp.]